MIVVPSLGDSRLPHSFWEKVRLGSIPVHRPDLGPCWEWTAYKQPKGYGRYKEGLAHKFAYDRLVGPLPPGLVSDHLCRNRACVDVSHIEPVTNGENIRRGDHQHRRKTHCPYGHPYSGSNLRVRSDGARRCITCQREYDKQYQRVRRLLGRATTP